MSRHNKLRKICITVAFNTYNTFSRLYRANQTSFQYLIFIKADSVFFKLMFLAINFGCFVTFFLCVVDFSSLSSFEFILLKKIDLISLLLLLIPFISPKILLENRSTYLNII